jgi:hypothetical protein
MCICCRVYAERRQLNERLFSLLQPPPPEQPEYADVLREVLLSASQRSRALCSGRTISSSLQRVCCAIGSSVMAQAGEPEAWEPDAVSHSSQLQLYKV